jgi:hypothetical protein
MDSWRDRVIKRQSGSSAQTVLDANPDFSKIPIVKLLGALNPAQLWAVIVALFGVVAAAFALGAKLTGKIG